MEENKARNEEIAKKEGKKKALISLTLVYFICHIQFF